MALEAGDEVRVMVMPGEGRSPPERHGCGVCRGQPAGSFDIRTGPEGVERDVPPRRAVCGVDQDPDLHYKINVQGTEALMKEAIRADLEKVVYTSSIAAIGINPGEMSNEETLFNSWPWASEYIMSSILPTRWSRAW